MHSIWNRFKLHNISRTPDCILWCSRSFNLYDCEIRGNSNSSWQSIKHLLTYIVCSTYVRRINKLMVFLYPYPSQRQNTLFGTKWKLRLSSMNSVSDLWAVAENESLWRPGMRKVSLQHGHESKFWAHILLFNFYFRLWPLEYIKKSI